MRSHHSLARLCALIELFFLAAISGPAVSADVSLAAGAYSSSPLRILALRVDFQPDDLATTTGSGLFDLGGSSDYHLDRPPHNRTFFQHQLLALAGYFQRVSRGKLILQSDVYPVDEDRAYHLPHDMAYYSGREDETLQIKGWAEILRDAVEAAKTDGGIDFNLYQSILVFHAGVGQDFSFDLDPTPYDIQSVYIDFATLQQGLAPGSADFKGIALPGELYLRDGLILPETQNQEGLDLGLLGTMTLLTGSRLGMPSLFDTRSGRAGIGRWGLMDQGSANFQGFIPAEPGAWEKLHMGWETAIEVRNGENLRLGSSSVVSAPRILKIPISDKEYFLVENRQRDPNHDKLAIGRDEQGRRAEFDSTGRVVAPADIGVITRIDDYDYGLPGSGILIWHVDERIIEQGLVENEVNVNRDHRGVDLVECDGAQDIGYIYSMFDAAYGAENGDYWDAWWRGNESHLVVNTSDEVAFSSTSIPDSRAYDGANTHIRLDHFSERDTIMTVNVRSDYAQPGFPRATGKQFALGALLAIPSAAGQTGSLLAVASDGGVYGWTANGSPLLGANTSLIATTEDSVFLPPAIADVDGDGIDNLIAVDKNGRLYAWLLQDKIVVDSQLDPLFSFPGNHPATAGPMILALPGRSTPLMVVGYSSGTCRLYGYTMDGSDYNAELPLTTAPICGLAATEAETSVFLATSLDGKLFACDAVPAKVVWQKNLAFSGESQPLVVDLDGDGSSEIVVVSAQGDVQQFTFDGMDLGVHQPAVALTQGSLPALGDIDADGQPEILINSHQGLVALEGSGAMTLNFPAVYGADGSGPVLPVVWRIDKDLADAYVIASGGDGMVHAFDSRGRESDDFPLTAGASLATSPVLSDLDGDDRVEMAGISADGVLYVWKTAWTASTQLDWPLLGGDLRRNFLWKGSVPALPVTNDWLPAKKVFCYPNPTADDRTVIRFSLGKSAERVTIAFYDLAGNFSGRIELTNLPAGDHETLWSVQNIASGVYLARVEAQAGGETKFKFVKIAVIK